MISLEMFQLVETGFESATNIHLIYSLGLHLSNVNYLHLLQNEQVIAREILESHD